MWATAINAFGELESARMVLYIVVAVYMVIGRFDTKKLQEEISYIKRNQFKAAFYNANLPITERLDAGHKYLEEGGNSRTKADIELLAKKHADSWLQIQSAERNGE